MVMWWKHLSLFLFSCTTTTAFPQLLFENMRLQILGIKTTCSSIQTILENEILLEMYKMEKVVKSTLLQGAFK